MLGFFFSFAQLRLSYTVIDTPGEVRYDIGSPHRSCLITDEDQVIATYIAVFRIVVAACEAIPQLVLQLCLFGKRYAESGEYGDSFWGLAALSLVTTVATVASTWSGCIQPGEILL